ncbi:hypothetical protein ONZ45_g9167 [Pleurotus djamor]|nr:hypothetical protein ONZ45_g9167 [Pleurotus djamor]
MSQPIAIVAGGGKNLGAQISKLLASQSYSVVIHYNSTSSASESEKTLSEITSAGGQAWLFQADLSDVKKIEALFEFAKSKGSVKVAINTVGKVLKKTLVDISEAEYDEMFNVNSKIAFFFIQYALKTVIDGGSIITIVTSLLAAYTGFYSSYQGSKSPVEWFTKAASKEAMSRSILVNAIAPGPMDTPFFYAQESDDAVAYHKSSAAEGRLTKVEDIVPIVELLVSKQHWINGQLKIFQTIFSNGGTDSTRQQIYVCQLRPQWTIAYSRSTLFVFITREVDVWTDYVQRCPIRLYDIQDECLVERDSFGYPIKENLESFVASQWPQESRGKYLPDDIVEQLWSQLRSYGAYAILSHRWGKNELTYKELRKGQVDPSRHLKFLKFCEAAKDYGCRYVWIDTGCINKSSSTELDESIRSMFTWYKHSYVCIALLSASSADDWEHDPWFTRGWALQELLAPSRMVFYDKNWTRLFSKVLKFDILRTSTNDLGPDKDIQRQIVDEHCYDGEKGGEGDIFRRKIAKAATYGEGRERAFYRLQVACGESGAGRSIFLWNCDATSTSKWNSLVARDVIDFQRSYGQLSAELLWDGIEIDPDNIDHSFTFTNCGLRISVTMHDIVSAEPIPAASFSKYFMIRGSDQRIRAYFTTVRSVNEIMEYKLAVLGTDEYQTPFVVLLEKSGSLKLPTYKRVSSNVHAKTLPSLSFLTSHRPRTIFVL